MSAVVAAQCGALAAEAGTVAYWRMEGDGVTTPTDGTFVMDTNGMAGVQPTGIPIIDVSGNGNTMYTWDNNVTGHQYRGNVPAPTVPLTGAANNFSIQNNGGFPASFTWSSQTLPTGIDAQTIAPLQWTIEASVQATALGGFRAFVGRDGRAVAGDANLAPLYFGTNPNNTLRINFADQAGNFHAANDTTPIVAGQWYNVAAVSDGLSLKLYKDSGTGYQLVSTTDISASANAAMANAAANSRGETWSWTLGRGRYGASNDPTQNHGDRWLGYIDEVRISDAALDPTQFLFHNNIVVEPNNLVWVGGQNDNAWDVGVTQNFTEAGTPTTFASADIVTFDNTGTGTANLTGSLFVSGVTISRTADLVWSGTGGITGTGAVNKTGNGKLTVSNAAGNSFSGGMTIAGGIVEVTGPAIGNAPMLGTGAIVNNGTIVANRDDTLFIANNISGTGSIVVDQAAVLSGVNTFDGTVTVNAETLFLDSATALGSAVGGTVVNNGGQIAVFIGNFDFGLEPISIAGDGHADGVIRVGGNRTVTMGGPVTVAASSVINIDGGSRLNLNGALTGGSADLTKNGTGLLVIGGDATYNNLSITGGTVRIGNGGITGNLGSGIVSLAGNLQFGRTDAVTVSNFITGTGSVFNVGAGTTTLDNASSDFTGEVGATAGTLILAGPTKAATFTAAADGHLQVASAAAIDPFSLFTVQVTANNLQTGSLDLSNNLTDLFPGLGISFSGRNNASSGIRSVSGNNSIAANIVLQAGGSLYQIESAAGASLTINGGISAAVTDARNVVFAGEGAGTVNGVIDNGTATVNVGKTGAGTWTLTAANTYTGTTGVEAGTLRLQTNLTNSSGLNVTGGTLQLATGGANSRVIKVPAANAVVTGTGQVDITDNKMILTGAGTAGGFDTATGQYAGANRLAQTGRGDGSWNGPGIMTSQTHADTGLTAVAVALASETPYAGGTFAGQNVAADDVLVMYTYGGDADLNGAIDSDDYFAIDSNFNLSGSVFGWTKGDFDYNGAIDSDDYFIIDSNFNNQILGQFPGSDAAPQGVAAVPEPASLGVLALASAGLLGRRRRNVR